MAGPVPAIHVFGLMLQKKGFKMWLKTWMPGARPGMAAENHDKRLIL